MALLLNILMLCASYIPNVNIVILEVAIYSIIAILYCFSPRRRMSRGNNRVVFLLWILVILLFLFRVSWDLLVVGTEQKLYGSDGSVFVFFLFFILIPALFLPRLDYRKFDCGLFLRVCTWVIASALTISFIDNVFFSSIALTGDGRFNANDSLGTIEYAYLGGVLLVICFSRLQSRTNIFLKSVLFALIALSLVTIVLAGTRSVYVGLSVVVLIYLVAVRKYKVLIYFALVVAALFIFKEPLLNIFHNLGSNSLDRLYNSFTSGDHTSGRSILYKKAIEDICSNPFLGKSAFFSYNGQNYIHNSVLEITRAIGFLGGILFIVLNVVILKYCVHIIRRRDEYMFFPMLFILYLVNGLFSNSVIRLSMYWYSLFIVMGLHTSLIDKRIEFNKL